ncbi:MAG: UDP-N-acetylenolpyruvoylglucosamine reductase [Planctomycetota bacterium]|nr:MAG: UDP-N-acetylenolpyruvoylglucosamine reductase [Planctomycetota bacterium]
MEQRTHRIPSEQHSRPRRATAGHPAEALDAAVQELRSRFPEISFAAEPLARHTTLRVGGDAALFVTPRTPAETAQVLAAVRAAGLPLFVMGGGSNLLVQEEGFAGVVLNLEALRWVQVQGTRMRLGAGTPLALAVRRAMEAGLAGMQGLVGIPGTVGGAVAMNAGGRHAEMAEVLEAVRVMEPDGRVHWLPRDAIGFGYRTSGLGPRVVLEAVVRLAPGDRMRIVEEMARLLRHKRATQPLGQRSAGCIFKNPAPDRAAGWLIERSGLKGRRCGGAEVSPRHANFIVNQGQASAGDVVELVRAVRREVLARFGTPLVLEVRVLGARGLVNL